MGCRIKGPPIVCMYLRINILKLQFGHGGSRKAPKSNPHPVAARAGGRQMTPKKYIMPFKSRLYEASPTFRHLNSSCPPLPYAGARERSPVTSAAAKLPRPSEARRSRLRCRRRECAYPTAAPRLPRSVLVCGSSTLVN